MKCTMSSGSEVPITKWKLNGQLPMSFCIGWKVEPDTISYHFYEPTLYEILL